MLDWLKKSMTHIKDIIESKEWIQCSKCKGTGINAHGGVCEHCNGEGAKY
ncbi:hypothetical protein SAMN05444392_10542 [Seinonella peptonophila]|uniref:Tryptophan RNA-binding attenuator protein inhibitory protein n=1 Tax=Seinonella peptonophila TaxID=112248 RepID=A0A1M4XK68_9BACL|nr:hypothetical protein [Seinonella peptonophila]SHE93820.1 hypothetical protein SAMN05444392_10542 [Seinonella peptonophila]